jgi:hypothetical protein
MFFLHSDIGEFIHNTYFSPGQYNNQLKLDKAQHLNELVMFRPATARSTFMTYGIL